MSQIGFKAAMLAAVLDGTKTETRRVVKPKDEHPAHLYDGYPVVPGLLETGEWGWIQDGCTVGLIGRCPYGQPGDLLHVGEPLVPQYGFAFYERDKDPVMSEQIVPSHVPWRWKVRKLSGRFCPKVYRRIWLRVDGVRVERVREMTFAAAIAEGVPLVPSAMADFAVLWDSINLKRGFGWEVNPWVWVVRFSVVSTTGRPA